MSELVKWMVPRYPVATLPNASLALMVTVATPAVNGLAMPAIEKLAAAAGVTVRPVWTPVMVAIVVSVAVTVREPAVRSVTPAANVWLPESAAMKV